MPSSRPWKDDRVLVSIIRDISQHPGKESLVLDRRAREYNLSWPQMYSHLPKFPDRLNFGSPNIRSLASGCAVWHPETRDEALQSWSNAANLERTVGFELEEPGSRIYRSWSLMGRLSAYRWALSVQSDLLHYLQQWLSLYWWLESLSSVVLPDGRISLRCGARSQGAYDRLKSDYPLSIVLHPQWLWRRKPHPLPDASWRTSDEILFFDSFAREIKLCSAGVRIGPVIEIRERISHDLPKWPTIAPTTYYRTSNGLAVWCEKSDINGNTPGIAAMIYHSDSNTFTYAPTPSRDHKRQKRVPQSITRVGNQLHFQQSAPGTPENLILDLPTGNVLYEIRHDQNGLTIVQ